MSLDSIKHIDIGEYLKSIGISPQRSNGHYSLYHSPFREDHNASLKVDYNRNLWVDYGTGEGGSIIDLVSKLENCSIGEAIKRLEDKSFSFHWDNPAPPQRESAIMIEKVQPIENLALIAYLKERYININIAREQCSEVHYSVAGKPYFAIGFKNDKGGFVLRNKYSKACTSADITTISKGQQHCCVFEGFIDYLSFLSIRGKTNIDSDIVILNSVSNLSKAAEFLNRHDTIYAFLDNDNAGRNCLNEIHKFGKIVSDQSGQYRGYKDLNDYLCKKQIQQKRGMRL